jgi:hypothetical protein
MLISLPKSATVISVAALLLAAASSTSAFCPTPRTTYQTCLYKKASSRAPPSKGFGSASGGASSTANGKQQNASGSSATMVSTATSTTTDRFPYAGRIRPFPQSPQRRVTDESIIKPDYATTGIPRHGASNLLPWIIPVKSPLEISKMRVSGRMAREILDLAGRAVAPGVTTDEIDALVHEEIIKVSFYVLYVMIACSGFDFTTDLLSLVSPMPSLLTISHFPY